MVTTGTEHTSEPSSAAGRRRNRTVGVVLAPVQQSRSGIGLLAAVRRHWMVLVLLLLGTALRVVTQLAYTPAMLYIDSYRYLNHLQNGFDPTGLNPIGYSLLLYPVANTIGLGGMVVLQHLAGLGMALAVYVLAQRWGAPRWVAALATIPMLLDAYQLHIEQMIMSDPLFQVLLLVAVWALISRGTPTTKRAAVAGLMLGLAVTVRGVGITAFIPALLFLVVVGASWREPGGWRRIGARVAAFVAALVVVLGGYASYYAAWTGSPGLVQQTGSAAFARAATVAECDQLNLDRYEAQFCPDIPKSARPGIDIYNGKYGGMASEVPPGRDYDQLGSAFVHQVVIQQPFDLARAVITDFGKGFSPIRETLPGDVAVERWQFQIDYPQYNWPLHFINSFFDRYDDASAAVNTDLTSFLRAYQLNGGYTWGPVQAVALLLGVLTSLGLARKRSAMAAPIFLVTLMTFTVLGTAAAYEFSWRYQLPANVLIPLAGALALSALLGPLRRPRPVSARLRRYPDPVDAAAVREFDQHHDAPIFAPVVVVIAAFNEEGGIRSVLDEIPRRAHSMDVDVLVVSDGSSDDTVELARRHGSYVCAPQTNRGQGAALRLGYQLAARGGARYVVTTDADGQYDPYELEQLLTPLVTDRADFVTGSRRLGVEETADRVRWLGVRVFAWLASLLTWRRITDTSFGFRAMRTDLAASVPLRQPQYQSSELLLRVIAMGARVQELGMTMRLRNSGETRKGGNISYGMSYAKVMLGTWISEFVFGRNKRAGTWQAESREDLPSSF